MTRPRALLVLGFGMLVGLLGLTSLGSPASAPQLGRMVHAAATAQRGYVLVDTAGVTWGFGGAAAAGSLSGTPLAAPVVDAASTPTGLGHVMVASDGGVFAFGDAPFLGSMGGTRLNAPIVGIDVTRSGAGYILFAADGGVFTFGDAQFRGSLGSLRLNQPIVGAALNKANDGYILAAGDGGVFAFGNARFGGSMARTPLNGPVVEIMMADDGPGYALIAGDGGIFAFSGFPFLGSLGSLRLNSPINDAAPSSTGDGYNLLASDGGVFAFGDAPFAGSLGGTPVARPIIAILGLSNEAPNALTDSYTATEDTVLRTSAAAGVLANDADDDGDPLAASLVTGPTRGTLTLSSNGSFTYSPNANTSGTDAFTYRATDSNGASDTATATISVAAVNDAPVAVADAAVTDEDTPLVVTAPGVLTNDTDVDLDPLTAVLVTSPAKGSLTLSARGSFTYIPNANSNGADSFTYKANDGRADSNVVTVSLTVTAVDEAPTVVNDAYSTGEDTPLTVAASGVLANDTDVDGSPFTAAVVTGPTKGSLSLNTNGSFTYTPNANTNGADFFTYKANDGTADSNVATVSLSVAPVNDAPVAVDDTSTTNEDTPLTVTTPGVLGNDTDVEGNPLTAVLETGPASGTLTMNSGGSFVYTPNVNFNGADSFTYKANDGVADSNVATVNITVNAVNEAPVAVNDAYSTDEDTLLTVAAAGVLANDTDVEGNPLSAAVVTGPTRGSLSLNTNGSFTYTPTANTNGADSFTYKANDGAADSNVATVSLTVGGVNDAPVAVNDISTTNEDTPLTVTTPGVLGNDTDADGNPLTAVLETGPASGTLTLNPGGSFVYTPNVNFNGADSFTYKARDGTADSNVATVNITVNAVNDGPVVLEDAYGTDEDTPLTVAAAGVLANDTDVEGNTLTAILVNAPTKGDLTLNSDGSFAYTLNANATGIDSFTYKANDGTADSNVATVNLTVSPVNDPPAAGNNFFLINEDTPLNITAPGVLANDTDVENDALTAVQLTTPTLGLLTFNADGSFAYTPNTNATGVDSFTYKANDGTADSNVATVFITVDAVNDPPSAVDDGPFQTVTDTNLMLTTPGVLANDSDADGQSLTAGNASDPANGSVTLDPDGSFSYTPDNGFNGTDTFTYDVTDGTATDTGQVTINVVPPNAAPTAEATFGSGNEDGGGITVTLTGHDADGDALSFTAGTATNGLVTVPGSVSCDANTPSTCTTSLTYTPNANFSGGDSFTYTVNDGTVDSAAATATITVNPVNDAPSFTVGGNQTVLEDAGAQTVNGWATGISAGPADESGQAVAINLVSTTDDTLFSVLPSVDPTGALAYTPAPDANGSATVTWRVTDDGGTANGGDDTGGDQTSTITMTGVNDAPSFTKGADQALAEDAGAQSVSNWATAVSKGPANESSQSLTFEVTGNDNAGLFSAGPAVSSTGTLTYTSSANQYGTANVNLRVTDNGGTANGGDDTSDTQTFTITVATVNDAPVAAAKAYTVQASMKISLGGLLVGATDPNDVAGGAGWTPSFTLGSITPGAGCIGCTISNVNNAAGTFDFDPPAGGTGTYTVTYTVLDNGTPAPGAASAPQTITFTVNGPVIWFVATTAPAGGTGRLSAPFNTLSSATTAMGTDTNERIFVASGNVSGNVTLATDGWLLSEAATGASFDSIMGISPPTGTIARPAVNGTQRTLTGTVTLGTNSVVRGFDLAPASGSQGLVASGKTGLTVNQVSVTTTNARAVNLSSSSGVFTLKRVQATGADRGISLVTVNTSTGSFTVTGDGSASSGGVITTSTAAGSAGSPEGGIYLSDTKNVSLAWMTVSSNVANGIYGTNVTTLTLTDSTVSNNGTNESLDHSGIHFANLLGTSSITRVTVFGSREDNAKVLNTSGTAALTVSDSTFRDNNASVGANGLYVDASGSANVTFTSTNNTILRNHTSGLAIFGQSSVKMSVTVTGGTYVTDNGVGLDIETNGSGGMAFSVIGGTVTGCSACGVPVNVYKGTGATGTGLNATAGTITGMTVSNGNSLNAPGIWVHGEGAGAARIAVTNNNVAQVAHYGIYASFGNNSAGAQAVDLTVTGNSVNPGSTAGTLEGIFVDSGLLTGDTTTTCADIRSNTVTNPLDDDIRVRNRQAGTSLRLPGYSGNATDHTAVANFLRNQNTIADAFSSANASSTGMTGGNPTSCNAP